MKNLKAYSIIFILLALNVYLMVSFIALQFVNPIQYLSNVPNLGFDKHLLIGVILAYFAILYYAVCKVYVIIKTD